MSESALASRIREVLKDHQRDGLNVIGNVDKLVVRLLEAVHDWEDEQGKVQRRSA